VDRNSIPESPGPPRVDRNSIPESDNAVDCPSLSWAISSTALPQRPQKREPSGNSDLQKAHCIMPIVALLFNGISSKSIRMNMRLY
jgi:hypothetical protein